MVDQEPAIERRFPSDDAALGFLAGGGEMGARIRTYDWAGTRIGPPRTWPEALKTLTGLMLASRQPMFIIWGSDQVWLNNDAFTPILGRKHPVALGKAALDIWGEARGDLEPLFGRVFAGEPVHMEDITLQLDRRGRLEEAHFTYSYTPARDENGAVAGLFGVCTETTDQIQITLQATQERERFAELFEQAPGFMAVLRGPNHLIELANPSYLQLVGHREVVGKTVAEALPEVVGQGYVELLDGVFRTGETYAAHGAKLAVQVGPGGPAADRFLDFVYQPIRDGEGRVTGIFVEGADVTDRTAAERLARETEDRLQAALSAGQGIGAWDWDVQTDLVVADERFARLYGVDADRARTGAPIAEFFRGIHPADMPSVQEKVDQAVRTGGDFSAEYRLVQPDGGDRWVLAQGRCHLSENGRPLHFPGLSFDISSRKHAERRSEALVALTDRIRDIDDLDELACAAAQILGETLEVDRAGYGLVDVPSETITVKRDWNTPGVQSLAGVLRFRDYGSYIEDLARGQTVIVADADQDPRTAGNAAALRAINARALVNMPLTEQGGVVALLYLNHGKPRAWSAEDLALVREFAERTRTATERLRASVALRESQARLQLANETLEANVQTRTHELMVTEAALRQSQKMEAVGQLTGGIAHDFNNLLMTIGGSLDLLEKRISEGRLDGISRYISAAHEASRRASSLTQRLLAFARRQTLDPKVVNINRVVAGMADLVRRSVGPDVQVEVVEAGGLWGAKLDPSQLENAILNLCINARDAMAPDGGRITIETANKWLDQRAARERDLPSGQYVSLCVTDTGTGMDEDVIAKVFDPFFTTKPLGQGTGLGLSMIYGFVRQSGGQVRIYSEVGKGTTMCLYFPRFAGEVADDDALAAEEEIVDPGAGETVLVIDDEAAIRMLIVEVLTESGYRVFEAEDGASGLKLLHGEGRIDLLVTDVGLPGGLNGRQVADAARTKRPSLKVLFITGFAENAVVGNGHLEPGMSVITKPFGITTFANKVRELIDL